MNDIQVFRNEQFGEVRTITQDGEPWFVAKDVCDYFGVTNRNRVLQSLDEDEKGGTQMNTPGGPQNVTIISESGLYSLLFALQPTKARGVTDEYIEKRCTELQRFKRWITHEVIPTIRRHGAYATETTIESIIADPENGIKLLQALKQEQERRKEAEALAEAQKPKVLFADAVEASDNTILVGELAKILRQNGIETGQNRLFRWMRDNGYIMRYKNTPTQYSMELGLMTIKERAINNPDGSVKLTQTTLITGAGQRYFINKFLGGRTSDNS